VGVSIIAAPVLQKNCGKSRVIAVACGREGRGKGKKEEKKIRRK